MIRKTYNLGTRIAYDFIYRYCILLNWAFGYKPSVIRVVSENEDEVKNLEFPRKFAETMGEIYSKGPCDASRDESEVSSLENKIE